MARHTLVAAALCAIMSNLTTAGAQTPMDGRIIRVVYKLPSGGTWGFHLAHMKDGRYCVRFGNPGRLGLSIIERVADICFDRVPSAVQQTPERTSKAGDARQRGKIITVSTHQKGSIESSGTSITLKIATCNRAEYETEHRCFPNRFVVRMNGEDCSAELALFRDKAVATTCEHYAAW